MSTYNITTSNIKVFPSVQRDEVESKKLTEARIVGLVNRLFNQDGFVINHVIDDEISTGTFQFSIHGYYFEVTDISEILQEFSTSSQIWAYITLKDLSGVGNKDYYVLDSQDYDNKYIGITFTDSEPSDTYYKLKLVEKTSNVWKISKESVLIIVPDAIDGGDISE